MYFSRVCTFFWAASFIPSFRNGLGKSKTLVLEGCVPPNIHPWGNNSSAARRRIRTFSVGMEDVFFLWLYTLVVGQNRDVSSFLIRKKFSPFLHVMDAKAKEAHSKRSRRDLQIRRMRQMMCVCLRSPTACPRSKVSKVKGYILETKLFWHLVGKAKMRLRTTHFFEFFVNKQLKM